MAGLGGFPLHYRVSVVVAWVLCGLSVLCLVSTWLPEPYVAPRWLVFALFLAVAPVFAMAFLLPPVEGLTEVGHRDASALLPWIGLVPGRLRAVHGALVLLAFVGFVSGAASADDVFADAHGYHRRYKDRTAHPHLVVDITEAEYDAATVGELRLFSAGPIAFQSIGGLVIFATGLAATSRRRTAQNLPGGHRSAPAPSQCRIRRRSPW